MADIFIKACFRNIFIQKAKIVYLKVLSRIHFQRNKDRDQHSSQTSTLTRSSLRPFCGCSAHSVSEILAASRNLSTESLEEAERGLKNTEGSKVLIKEVSKEFWS